MELLFPTKWKSQLLYFSHSSRRPNFKCHLLQPLRPPTQNLLRHHPQLLRPTIPLLRLHLQLPLALRTHLHNHHLLHMHRHLRPLPRLPRRTPPRLHPKTNYLKNFCEKMRLPGLEPGTSTLSVLRSNQLSYNRIRKMLRI